MQFVKFGKNGTKVRVLAILALLLIAGCTSVDKQRNLHANELRLIFSGKPTTVPFAVISHGFNHVYDENPDAQTNIVGQGMDTDIRDASYDHVQEVPGAYFGFHIARIRTVLKFDTSSLSDPVVVTIITEGIKTGTVTLTKSPIITYQIIQY